MFVTNRAPGPPTPSHQIPQNRIYGKPQNYHHTRYWGDSKRFGRFESCSIRIFWIYLDIFSLHDLGSVQTQYNFAHSRLRPASNGGLEAGRGNWAQTLKLYQGAKSRSEKIFMWVQKIWIVSIEDIQNLLDLGSYLLSQEYYKPPKSLRCNYGIVEGGGGILFFLSFLDKFLSFDDFGFFFV